jgi:hypothetical protein
MAEGTSKGVRGQRVSGGWIGYIVAEGHRVWMLPGEHVVMRSLGCNGSICESCGCCTHCDSCVCPLGPCANESCGCWITEHYLET